MRYLVTIVVVLGLSICGITIGVLTYQSLIEDQILVPPPPIPLSGSTIEPRCVSYRVYGHDFTPYLEFGFVEASLVDGVSCSGLATVTDPAGTTYEVPFTGQILFNRALELKNGHENWTTSARGPR